MNDSLERLRIASHRKSRSSAPLWSIFCGVLILTAGIAFYAVPRASDHDRSGAKSGPRVVSKPAEVAPSDRMNSEAIAPKETARIDGATNRVEGKGILLTVSGYLVARERIEISPRFMGVVKWIGVRKGDSVTNGQVVVVLDDTEYQARLAENEGLLAVAKVAVDRALMDLRRTTDLVERQVEMQKVLDDSRLNLRSAEAHVQQIQGTRKTIETWLNWCVIRSPVNGVVLEKLVDPNELVTPQTFGGGRGPSSSLIAVADLKDLQVEIDINESDLAKVSLGQKCVLFPQAYAHKRYDGVVAEIAPEANRQKGTLQIKIQILSPDRFLTPELSATVEFSKP